MEFIGCNSNECDIDLKSLIDKIDDIKPDTDLYSKLVDEQIDVVEEEVELEL